jgi:hypothetical protein
MTTRTVILGMLLAIFLSGYCYFNDSVVRQGSLVSDLLPVFAYGGLVVFVMLVHPLLRRVKSLREWTKAEIAGLVSLLLIVCAIPSWGLVQCLPTSIMMPHHFSRQRPGWVKHEITSVAPKRMMPDASDTDGVLNSYVSGMAVGDGHVEIWKVPWRAWLPALAFWAPLLITVALATLGLTLVVHRQWVHHEQLPFPISQFAHSLLPENGQVGLLKNHVFWIGFAFIFLLQINNYLFRWWPERLIQIPTYLDFSSLGPHFTTLMDGQGGLLLRPRLIFSVIGLAYLISTDVSFSMAIGPVVYCLLMGWLLQFGIELRSGDHMSTKIEAFLFTGGYFGILVMVVYFGRHFYWEVLKKSLSKLPAGNGPGSAQNNVVDLPVWGMRLFLIGLAAFIAQLVLVGLDWRFALLYTGLAWMIFVVVSRTIAETGAFHIGTEIFPGAILLGFFGAASLGPKTVVIMFLVSVVVLVAPGWSPMPFMVQAFKLADMSRVDVSRLAKWAILLIVLSIAVAIPATIYVQYDQGAPSRGWPYMVSSFPFENLVKWQDRLTSQGMLETSRQTKGWDKLQLTSPNWACVTAFFVALGIALGIGFCRLRFTWWPLHPVIFVFLGGYQGKAMAGSFFIGWILKSAVMRYGGAKLYNRLTPLMIGVIAGDVTSRFVPMLVGTIYYLVTGQQP